MSKKNVFVIGLDPFNLTHLQQLPLASECAFHAALEEEEIRGGSEYDVDALVALASERVEGFSGSVDGIAAYRDFPATTILPILCQRFGVPGPSLQSVFTCEHKYWSRLEQQKVIPEHVPQFRAFDPMDEDAYRRLDLHPPFWVKPIKSFRSYLAYQIGSRAQFNEVMAKVRPEIGHIVRPFLHLMASYGMPDELTEMRQSCLAESPIGGSQCTLEGYVHRGRVIGYGVVDSIREADRSSFARYEYPSALPLEVQHRMVDTARQVLVQIGLDNSPFNVEFFWDQTKDTIYLLEINPRCSQSHADLFEKVHGYSHLQVMLSLALGRKPIPLRNEGPFRVAGNFMLRAYQPGRMRRVPGLAELERLAGEQPETRIKIRVREGQHLSELTNEDSYSYELANLFIGAGDRGELVEKYERALQILRFEVEPDEPIVAIH